MLGAKDLKPRITVTDTTVECPVKDCSKTVVRQRRTFIKDRRFQCPDHGIYPTPTTFVYSDKLDNLLWTDPQDQKRLEAIIQFKRESRMEYDNSEDAVTWNVFRYLEKSNQLSIFLSSLINAPVAKAELVYWSYCQKEQGVWPELKEARKEFGERSQRSSEPDLIIVTDNQLFWIEAKFTADNETKPSNPQDTKKYVTGGDDWFQRVFKSNFKTMATDDKKYELMRFWLLGSWASAQLDRDFQLVNLVRAESEKDIGLRFGRHLKADSKRHFVRWTWESIYKFVSENAPQGRDKQKFMTYLETKTTGYNKDGELQPAFNL